MKPLTEIVTDRALEEQLRNEQYHSDKLQKLLDDNETLLSSERALRHDLNEQLQNALARSEQATKEKDSNVSWALTLQLQGQQKDFEIDRAGQDVTRLEEELAKLQLPPVEREQQFEIIQLERSPERPQPTLLDLSPVIDDLDEKCLELSPLLSSHSWEQPPLPPRPVPHAFTRVRHLLEGSFLQVLPGMQITEAGEEHCRPGDIGMVSGYSHGSQGVEDIENARHLEDSEVSISVRWTRTQKCSLVPRMSWIWFRFIRTPEPREGDFLQALPGADHVDEFGVEHYRVGDVGEAMSISSSGSSKVVRIRWSRTGKTSEVAQTSWTWFRVFRVPSAHSAETTHDVSAHIADLIADDAQDTCFSVLWIRAGQISREVKVGDTLQVLPGAGFVDPHGGGDYREGDVGKVTSSDCSVDRFGVQSVPSATVIWMRTGKTSTIPRESLSSFRFFRMQEPRIGDLLVAAADAEHTDGGEEHYIAGDSGSVVGILPAFGSGEGSLRVCWARTGQVTELPLAVWSAHFSLIPLKSNVPSYIRYPLGTVEDRV